MRKIFFLISFLTFANIIVYSQSTPLNIVSNNDKEVQILLSNRADLALIVEKKVDVEVLKNVSGVSKGFKIIPLLPFLPEYTPGIINIRAEEIEAEQNALRGSGGEILLNKKVERTYKGILLIFWIEKIKVSGIAAKIIK